MSNFRERLMQFMRGRYGGNDTLNKFLFGVFLFFLLVAIFSSKSSAANSIFNLLAIAVLVYSYFRIFSKNIARRQAENAKFLELTAPIRGFFGKKSGDKTGSSSAPSADRKSVFPRARERSRSPVRTAAITLSNGVKRCTGTFGHTSRNCGFGNMTFTMAVTADFVRHCIGGTVQRHAGR